MNNKKDEKSKNQQSLSEAYKELEEITLEFERGEIDLEESIPKFKRGLEIAKNLKLKFSKIENEIEEIKIQFQEEQEEKTDVSEDELSTDIETLKDELPF